METRLEEASGQTDKQAAFHSVLITIVDELESLEKYLAFAIKESNGLVLSRWLFSDTIQTLSSMSEDISVDQSEHLTVRYQLLLRVMGERSVAFEEQISQVCELLAFILEENQDWSGAAAILKQIPLETGTRVFGEMM